MGYLESAVFEVARLFFWPVLMLVLLSLAYALCALGAFGVEYVRRRQRPGQVLLLAQVSPVQERLELAVLKELECLRLCSRVAPMLGLIATMIPMGPALVAVASGEAQGVAQSLAPAFAAVIVALLAASISFTIHTVRRRWLLAEMVVCLELARARQLAGGA